MPNIKFSDVFPNKKPVIAVVHLMPLPGSPNYGGDRRKLYDQALEEVRIFMKHKVDGIIIENFRDKPFYPNRVPAETIASLAAVSKEILNEVNIPVGINALRNDAKASLAIATATGAQFIRVNVHMGAVMTEQGIIRGMSHKTLRLREKLKSNVLIFADVGVKHAKPIVDRGLDVEAKDLEERGGADAVIVTGERTGMETRLGDLKLVRNNVKLPVLVASGLTAENIADFYPVASGFIVGTYLKEDGQAENFVNEGRVKKLMDAVGKLRE
jgi:membrane complex biogenesis BtpA family protein